MTYRHTYIFRTKLEKAKHITKVKVAQSCLTLCDPIDGNPPGSPVPAILQARILE